MSERIIATWIPVVTQFAEWWIAEMQLCAAHNELKWVNQGDGAQLTFYCKQIAFNSMHSPLALNIMIIINRNIINCVRVSWAPTQHRPMLTNCISMSIDYVFSSVNYSWIVVGCDRIHGSRKIELIMEIISFFGIHLSAVGPKRHIIKHCCRIIAKITKWCSFIRLLQCDNGSSVWWSYSADQKNEPIQRSKQFAQLAKQKSEAKQSNEHTKSQLSQIAENADKQWISPHNTVIARTMMRSMRV